LLGFTVHGVAQFKTFGRQKMSIVIIATLFASSAAIAWRTMMATRRSKLLIAALILSVIALVCGFEAYFGEWRLIHCQFPNEFPNDPDSDHGIRLLILYWSTYGQWFLLLSALCWLFGIVLTGTALILKSNESSIK